MHAMAITFWVLWVLVVLLRLVTAYYGHEAILDETSPNLLVNPDFDLDIPTSAATNEWYILGSLTVVYEKLTIGCVNGNSCVSVKNREMKWKGLRNRVAKSTLPANSKFWFSMFIRYTGDSEKLFTVQYTFKTAFTNGTEVYEDMMDIIEGFRATNEWLYVGLEVQTLEDTSNVAYYEFYPDPEIGVDYVVDATSLRLINNTHWIKEASENIETNRKGVINVRTDIPACYNSADITVELEQTSGMFGLGTNVEAGILNNKKTEAVEGYNMAYSKYFQSHYNWAQLPADMNWLALEGNGKDTMDYEGIDGVLSWLHAYKYNVRGHFLHSNDELEHPDWVRNILNSTVFTTELERRVDYMTSHFTDNLQMAHWDVSYKHASGSYLQEKTDNPDILVDLIDRTKNADPQGKVFFDVSISEARQMKKYVNFARDLLNNTENIDGITATASFTNAEWSADLGFIQKRLDALSTFGLPIWVTDLKIPVMSNWELYVSNLLLLLFGNPYVEGIMVKDLSDFTQTYSGGDSLQNNNLGLVFDLVMNTLFKTKTTVSPGNGGEDINSVKGFYGRYDMTVKHHDTIVSKTSFDLTKDKDTDLHVAFDCPGTF